MSIILLSSFQQDLLSPPNFPDEERVDKFLTYVMIKNGAIYTLVGSKPMTTFRICPDIDEQEKRAIYAAQSEQLKKHISFEKFKPCREDCKQLWKDWKKVEKQYLGNQFLFLEFEKWESGIFINIPSAILVFNKYYDEFVKITGQHFTPEQAVYQIGNNSDPFWSKVVKNHYLMGILLGFGEKNSRCFQSEREKGIDFPIRKVSEEENLKILSINEITLPVFTVYDLNDDQVEKYRLEREKIINLYKNQDFKDFTLKILKQNMPPPKNG